MLRMWRTRVDPARVSEYERFAEHESLPMFKSQDGFLGVLFTRSGTECVVVSLWTDETVVNRLQSSSTYRATVARIEEAGFLLAESSVQAFTVHGGVLSHDAVAGL